MLRLPVVLALALSLVGTPAFAAGHHARGHKHGAAARAAKGHKAKGRLARLDQRIAALKQRLDAHPNAPAAVKAATGKLLTDLTVAQSDVAKLRAAKQAHDTATCKSMRGVLKSDLRTIRSDHSTLKQVIGEAVADARVIPDHRTHKHKKAGK